MGHNTLNGLLESLEFVLEEKIVSFSSAGGGCTSVFSGRVRTESGRDMFLKAGNRSRMFLCERNGLAELARPRILRVPEVISCGEDHLLTEWITDEPVHSRGFFRKFGQRLAALHRFQAAEFGFYEDNYIGETPQCNLPAPGEIHDWVEFYYRKRLLFQYKLAEENQLVSPGLKKGFLKLESVFESVLKGSEEPPSLLHGDLWSGNFLCDTNGDPVLIDPAVYYGHREADLAMTRLFGGFPPEFYTAYQDENPLQEGWKYRENIYRLYHVMNHLNLFGKSYLTEAEYILGKYTH